MITVGCWRSNYDSLFFIFQQGTVCPKCLGFCMVWLQMGVSENRLVPLNPMVLLIIIPMKNGYFIGNIPYFQTNPNDGTSSWWENDGHEISVASDMSDMWLSLKLVVGLENMHDRSYFVRWFGSSQYPGRVVVSNSYCLYPLVNVYIAMENHAMNR